VPARRTTSLRDVPTSHHRSPADLELARLPCAASHSFGRVSDGASCCCRSKPAGKWDATCCTACKCWCNLPNPCECPHWHQLYVWCCCRCGVHRTAWSLLGPLRGRPNRREPAVPSASLRCAHLCTPDARLRPPAEPLQQPKTAPRLSPGLGYGWATVSARNHCRRKNRKALGRGMTTRHGSAKTADAMRELATTKHQ